MATRTARPKPTAAGPSSDTGAFKRAKQDGRFFDIHARQWATEHVNNFVAVYRQRLVAVAPTIEELMASMEEQGVPPNEALVEFFFPKDVIAILNVW